MLQTTNVPSAGMTNSPTLMGGTSAEGARVDLIATGGLVGAPNTVGASVTVGVLVDGLAVGFRVGGT